MNKGSRKVKLGLGTNPGLTWRLANPCIFRLRSFSKGMKPLGSCQDKNLKKALNNMDTGEAQQCVTVPFILLSPS